MKFYNVFPNACGEFDEATIYQNLPQLAANIGLVLDCWPPDDLFQCSPEIFCNERLMSLLTTHHQPFSGIARFDKVQRVSVGANWLDRHPDAKPGQYWQVILNGQAMQDDIGYFCSTMRHLVLSERFLDFLAHNHVTEILGQQIDDTDLAMFFEKYESELKRTNYTGLPPKLFKIQIS